MYRENMDLVKQFDPEVGNAIQSEYDRQRRNIELIAVGKHRQPGRAWRRWAPC